MNHVMRVTVAAAALIAIPAVAFAQVGTTEEHRQRAEATAPRMERGPGIAVLLRSAPELQLSAEQVARLEAIESRLQQQNQPLIAQLREAGVAQRGASGGWVRGDRARERSPEQREQMRERRQEMTPEQREEMRQRMQDRARSITPEQRREMAQRFRVAQREVPVELRPVAEQLRENTTVAVREAREVLTPEQEARLQEVFRTRMADRGDRPGWQQRRGGDRQNFQRRSR
jgi:Spy/CpxP family protein refolding chaperone